MKRMLAGMSLPLLLLIVLPARAQAEGTKIGLVVTQRLLGQTEVGKAAAKALQARKKEAQEKLDKKAAELHDFEADLKKRAMVLSDEERKRARDELERQQREAARMKEDLERALQRAETEKLSEVNEFLTKIMVEYGKSHGYDAIFDASATVFFSDRSDLTDEIAKAANAAYKKKGD